MLSMYDISVKLTDMTTATNKIKFNLLCRVPMKCGIIYDALN